MVIKRTGSSFSLVGPAVTSTVSPARSLLSLSRMPAASAMSSGSLMRPSSSSPQARKPLPGPTKWTPRCLRILTFSCVAGFFHIALFMAGAISTGQVMASAVVESRSSAMPCASFAMMFAVAGAMIKSCAYFAREMCSISHGRSKPSTATL